MYITTREGSPPNAETYFCTQRSAWRSERHGMRVCVSPQQDVKDVRSCRPKLATPASWTSLLDKNPKADKLMRQKEW